MNLNDISIIDTKFTSTYLSCLFKFKDVEYYADYRYTMDHGNEMMIFATTEYCESLDEAITGNHIDWSDLYSCQESLSLGEFMECIVDFCIDLDEEEKEVH